MRLLPGELRQALARRVGPRAAVRMARPSALVVLLALTALSLLSTPAVPAALAMLRVVAAAAGSA